MSEPKNITVSVKDRLRDIARRENKSHQLLLLRYFQERFLYRLSLSKYRSHFCLKGAAFLYALEGEKSRVTKDIDFLGMRIPSKQAIIKEAILAICQIQYDKDGVTFNFDSLEIADIIKEGNYHGIRVGITAHLDRTKQKLQIDIGFGDVVTPYPNEMTYPVILEMDAPVLYAYSIESVIAEKFEAMIDLAEVNTRMKDFYDVYHLLRNHEVDKGLLKKAIQATFKKRGTPANQNHSLFFEAFYTDVNRIKLWRAWLDKTGLNASLEFSEIMNLIISQLKPIIEKLS